MRENCPSCGAAAFSNGDEFTCPLCGETWRSEQAKQRDYEEELAARYRREAEELEKENERQRQKLEAEKREWEEQRNRQREQEQRRYESSSDDSEERSYRRVSDRTASGNSSGSSSGRSTGRSSESGSSAPRNTYSEERGRLHHGGSSRGTFDYRMPNKTYRGMMHYSDRDVDDARAYFGFTRESTVTSRMLLGLLVGIIAGLIAYFFVWHGFWKAFGLGGAIFAVNYILVKFSRKFYWNLFYLWGIVAAAALLLFSSKWILPVLVLAAGIALGVKIGPGWFQLRRGREVADGMNSVDSLLDQSND